MKLSKEEIKKIEEFRAKIIAAKSRDVIKLLEDIGYEITDIEKLKSQLEAGKIAAPELFQKQGEKEE